MSPFKPKWLSGDDLRVVAIPDFDVGKTQEETLRREIGDELLDLIEELTMETYNGPNKK